MLASGHRLVRPGITTSRRAAPATGVRRSSWLVLHLLVALAPLALCFTEASPGRGFVVNFSVALGFVALSVLGLQFALAARFSRSSAPFGIDAVLTYHRQISFLAVVAAFGHPVLLFLARTSTGRCSTSCRPAAGQARLAVGGRAGGPHGRPRSGGAPCG